MGKIKIFNFQFSIFNWRKIFLLFILLLSFFLRVYRIDSFPGPLNRDEAGIGYNAYCLLKTAKDEHGKTLPLFFKSFGDWKMPLYIYTVVPSLALFGLNEFSVRFPSAFFGSLTVLVIYFLTRELFFNFTSEVKDKDTSEVLSCLLPIIASLLLAISPWHIHFSRQAYEVNLALFFLSLGSLLLIKKKILLSFLIFALVIFTYHGVILLSLGLFSYLLFLRKDKNINQKKKFLYLGLLLTVLFLSQFFQKRAVKDKFWQSTVFQEQSLFLERVFLPKKVHREAPWTSKIFHNRLAEGILAYWENYFFSLSSSFLFFGNDVNARFMINKKSLRLNLLILLPFYLGGIFFLLKNKDKKQFFWLFWLFLTPVLPAFLVRSPSAFRNLPQVIPLTVISSFALIYFLSKIKKRKLRVIVFLLFLVLLFADWLKIAEEYVFHLEGGLDYSYKETVKNFDYFEKKENESLIFKASHPEYSPYIFLAFYKKFDPGWFLKNVKRLPFDKEGFEHVQSIGPKYQFGPIDWGEPIKRNVVYLDLYQAIPGEIKDLGGTEKKIIENKMGEPLFFQFIYR